MSQAFVLLLMHLDHSGVQQAFGPFPGESEAAEARDQLKQWPTLPSHDDVWRILPLTGPWQAGGHSPA